MAMFEKQFNAYAKYSRPRSDGKHINLAQSDKWMRQAKIFDDKITQADTALAFNNLHREELNIDLYQKFIEEFAKEKHLDPQIIRDKMAKCGPPLEDRTRIESIVMKEVQDPSGYV